MKTHECGNKDCNNLVEEHFWLCYYCWKKREATPEYKFSQYMPANLKELTIIKQ